VNLCRACGQDFGSVSAFDAHRVGKHAYTYDEGMGMDPPRTDGRRCLSVEEMEAAQFVRNARGRWSLSKYVGAPGWAQRGNCAAETGRDESTSDKDVR
jgi:hypothetical protein